jgi:hypothetical protein
LVNINVENCKNLHQFYIVKFEAIRFAAAQAIIIGDNCIIFRSCSTNNHAIDILIIFIIADFSLFKLNSF